MSLPRGELYWRLTKDSVAPGYPRKISSDWRGLPGNIDAAFTWESSKATYFIKVLLIHNSRWTSGIQNLSDLAIFSY